MTAAQAYREVTGRTTNSDVQSVKMRKRNGVEAGIQELKAQNAQRAQMSREELMAFYADVIRTPADQVSPGSSSIQSFEKTEHGYKIRIVDKAAAGAALAKLTGWNSAELLEVGVGDSLKNYLLELRRQTLGAGRMSSMAGEQAAPIIELENGVNG